MPFGFVMDCGRAFENQSRDAVSGDDNGQID
jgi:hypothetical protein